MVNEKRVPLDYLQSALMKEKLSQLQQRCAEYGLDQSGKKDDLVQRLGALPQPQLQQLEIAVLAGGHRPDAAPPLFREAVTVFE